MQVFVDKEASFYDKKGLRMAMEFLRNPHIPLPNLHFF
jgi:hypothetical protein